MEREIIDLYTLQTSIRSALEGNFPDKLWVKAEISAIKSSIVIWNCPRAETAAWSPSLRR